MGGIYERALYEEDEDGSSRRDTPLGITQLTVYHNPEWLLDRELTEFVLSDDMFGKAFLDTNFDKGLKDGFEMNVALPYHYLLGAMITLRQTFSHPSFVETWSGCYDICKDKLRALFYADRVALSYSPSEGQNLLYRREVQRDSSIFPIRFSVRNLHFPTLGDEHPPSSEQLDLESTSFWEGVWGKGSRKPNKDLNTLTFSPNLSGHQKLIEDEEKY